MFSLTRRHLRLDSEPSWQVTGSTVHGPGPIRGNMGPGVSPADTEDRNETGTSSYHRRSDRQGRVHRPHLVSYVSVGNLTHKEI